MTAYYLTHPQVQIDPAVPVPEWSLSAVGRGRIEAIVKKPWVASLRRIVSSEERKATETAELIGRSIGIAVEIKPDMGENDRSATGFIAPDKFEAAADAFFANPDASWNGWETARAAQARIVSAVHEALNEHVARSPVLFVGHGAVGTLLKCHLAGRPVSRREDQSGGGGNIYAFGQAQLFCDWTPVDAFEGYV